MASHREIEVKLRTEPTKIAKIRRSPWWRGLERLQRQSLHSVYYDTTDHRLRDCHISLRTRTDGHSFVQTLKMPNGARRSGSSAPSGKRCSRTPFPIRRLVIDPALPDDFRKLTSADLQPVFDVEVKRETRRLVADGAQIDVSLDQGAVIAGEAREPLHEIELEMVSGDLPALFAEAQRLADLVDGRLHTRTKADIGYALGDAERRHWSRASKLSLTPEMTAGNSVHFIVLNSFAHLTANDDCARLNLHIEGVHQCRIALRRLRSAFKIYRPLLRRKRIAPIDEEVRWLGRILGAARDLDVLQAELLEPAIAALGEEKQLAPLMATLAAKKEPRPTAAWPRPWTSARYRHLLIALCALGHADDLSKAGEGTGLDQPLLELASAALTRAHERLLKRGRGFEELSKPERHEVRIALKRLRYALDFFSDIFEGERKKKFVKKLTRLQDDLGRMNDVAVAETMLARLVGVDGDGVAQRRGRTIGTTGVRRGRRSRLASPARGRDGRQAGQGLEIVRQGQAVLARARQQRRVIKPRRTGGATRARAHRMRRRTGCGLRLAVGPQFHAAKPQPARLCRALGAVAALLGLVALRLLGRLQRRRPDIREEHLFVRTRQRLDGLLQRQPLDRLDVVHQLADRLADCAHVPELHDLDLAVEPIGHRAEKLVHRHLVSGLFEDFALGGGQRTLARIELALRQYPSLIPAQSHDRDARPGTFSKYDSSGRQNRRAGLRRISHVKRYARRARGGQAKIYSSQNLECTCYVTPLSRPRQIEKILMTWFHSRLIRPTGAPPILIDAAGRRPSGDIRPGCHQIVMKRADTCRRDKVGAGDGLLQTFQLPVRGACLRR